MRPSAGKYEIENRSMLILYNIADYKKQFRYKNKRLCVRNVIQSKSAGRRKTIRRKKVKAKIALGTRICFIKFDANTTFHELTFTHTRE